MLKTKTIEQNKIIYKDFSFKQSGINRENYTISGVFSTGGVDRQDEIIDQNGWKLEEFLANPVVLFAHDHYTPAIGKVTKLEKDGSGNLAGDIQFAVEENELAKTVFNLYAGGFMKAFSVGFYNENYEVDQVNDQIILRENVLYEISCVNVPANAMALAYSKGIDVEPVRKAILERQVMKDVLPSANQQTEAEDSILGRQAGNNKRADDPSKKESANTPVDSKKAGAKPDHEMPLQTDPAKAVETISQSNTKTIRSAIRTLTDVLHAKMEADNQGGNKGSNTPATGGNKKIPVTLINRAIRELLKIKERV